MEVIAAALETSRPLIESGRHRLTLTPAPWPVHLNADPMRFAQVFSNLLNNAARLRATRGGRVNFTG